MLVWFNISFPPCNIGTDATVSPFIVATDSVDIVAVDKFCNRVVNRSSLISSRVSFDIRSRPAIPATCPLTRFPTPNIGMVVSKTLRFWKFMVLSFKLVSVLSLKILDILYYINILF